MKERPILFDGAMVRAVLDGRKTQTRRVVKGLTAETEKAMDANPGMKLALADDGHGGLYRNDIGGAVFAIPLPRCPYGAPGDRLWVRETFWDHDQGEPPEWDAEARDERVEYRASEWDRVDPFDAGGWRPSIHMPRWASRITLEITEVRVQRVQDISEADAVAEGCHDTDGALSQDMSATARGAYALLWDDLNASRGFGWAANPWVWVITFKRLEAPHAGRE